MSFQTAIGIIETRGLAAAIEAGDSAAKAANVQLLGYELSKGGGWVTVKFSGNVGAVQAALAAGSASARRVNKVISTLIIPRPHKDLEPLIHSPFNVYHDTEDVPDKSAAIASDLVAEAPAENTEQSSETLDSSAIAFEDEKSEMQQTVQKEPTEAFVQTPDVSDTEPEQITEPTDSVQDVPSVGEVAIEEDSMPEQDIPEERNPSSSNEVVEELVPPIKREEEICNLCGDMNCPRMKGEPRKQCMHYND